MRGISDTELTLSVTDEDVSVSPNGSRQDSYAHSSRIRSLGSVILYILLLGSGIACDSSQPDEDAGPSKGIHPISSPGTNWQRLQVQGDFIYLIHPRSGVQRLDLDDGDAGWQDLFGNEPKFPQGANASDFRQLRAITHAPSNSDLLIASYDDEAEPTVFVSLDAGGSWEEIRELNYAFSDGLTLFRSVFEFITHGDSTIGLSPLYRVSTLRASSWSVIEYDDEDEIDFAGVFQQSPGSSSTTWAGVHTFFFDSPLYLWYSKDHGLSWERTSPVLESAGNRDVNSLGIDATNHGAVAVAIDAPVDELYFTSDWGLSWSSIAPYQGCCKLVVSHPLAHGTFWASSGDSLYLSKDSGDSWTRSEWTSESLAQILDLGHHRSADRLFILTTNGLFQLVY